MPLLLHVCCMAMVALRVRQLWLFGTHSCLAMEAVLAMVAVCVRNSSCLSGALVSFCI